MAGGLKDPLTPMMNQYLRVKNRFKDALLFFRMGDFYEMFYEDAHVASKVLGIALTSRNKGENPVPMAGIPCKAMDQYLKKLIAGGFKVAVCDQVQDPKEAVGLVDRQVTRIITPGTLTEEDVLEGKENNFLASICFGDQVVGISWVDLSTGKFFSQEVKRVNFLDELRRVNPSECLVQESFLKGESPLLDKLKNEEKIFLTSCPDWIFDEDNAERTLLDHFGIETLEGFGFIERGVRIMAAGSIIHYLNETQKTSLGHINRLESIDSSGFLFLDRNTRECLELTGTIRGGKRRGSLLHVIDRTQTAMGGRMIRSWLLSPETDIARIRMRQDGVEELFNNATLSRTLFGLLGGIFDLERIISRVGCNRANPRDLAVLKDSLDALPQIREGAGQASSEILRGICSRIDLLEDVRAKVQAALVDGPPISLKDGGIIREGYHEELDELRSIKREGKEGLAAFQAREMERTSIPSLKVGYNKVFGYYIEVTHTHTGKIPPDYIRKQTLKNAERYITPELKEYESKVLSSEERSREIEYRLFLELRDTVAKETCRIQETSAALAELDALLSLAVVARENSYVRPEVVEEEVLQITDGRHPVLEKTLEGEPFVPNDIFLDEEENRFLIITGPNMAGKSTYIRQVALLALMTQMGSFIPAKSARVGIVDRIFTRVGASDELSSGKSTFMVEMSETANILNNATHKSLIILDEVGRGTSTFDGLSIAWAVTEYIQRHIKARTLFATHYHEITQLGNKWPGIRNFNIAVREWGEEIIFLHKIVEGSTDKSYGIHVARLAGIPKEVLERSKVLLANLEEQSLILDRRIARTGRERPKRSQPVQLTLFSLEEHPALKVLKEVDVLNLTPIEALNKLHELKEILDRERES